MELVTETSEQRPTGRPKALLDWQVIDKMLEAHCTAQSIAHRFGVDPQTLYNRCLSDHNLPFSVYSQLKRQQGDDLLREKQQEIALAGDKVMLVWLGKNRLGQTDKQEVNQVSNVDEMVAKRLMEAGYDETEARAIAAERYEVSGSVN